MCGPDVGWQALYDGKLYRWLRMAVYMVWAVSQPWISLGMVLMSSSMIASRIGPTSRFVPLGSQRRKTALFCSLLGRCQGEWGSQKNTLTPVSD